MSDGNRFYEMSLYKNYSEPKEFFKGTKLKNTIYGCHFVPFRAISCHFMPLVEL